MTTIESEKVIVNKAQEEVFKSLSDFNNFQKFMPEQVVDWTSTTDECSFNIKGMAPLGMKMFEKIPNSLIKISKNGKAPFDFTLNCKINQVENNSSELQLSFDADLNPFLKMMAEKPLTNFLNLLVNKYKELSESGKM